MLLDHLEIAGIEPRKANTISRGPIQSTMASRASQMKDWLLLICKENAPGYE